MPHLTTPRLLSALWQLFRREQALVLAIALPLVFLPAFALLLLADPVPPLPAAPRDEAAMQAWLALLNAWGQGNALWYLLGDAIATWGAAALAVLLVDPARPTVGGALRTAAMRFLAFLGVSMLVAVPVGAGLWLFVLPGLYAQARLVAALPIVARERGAGVWRAARRGVAVTRGQGLAVTGAVVAFFLAQWLLVAPLAAIAGGLRAGGGSPLALALTDAALALAGTAYHVAVLLLGVIVWRAGAGGGR